MQIIVDIHEGKDGRPIGTVRPVDQPDTRSFSGNLEFLALVESLYQTGTGAGPGLDGGDRTGGGDR